MTTLEQRQKMIALSLEGVSFAAIARQLGCSKWTVRKWVRAYKKRVFSFKDGSTEASYFAAYF